MSSSSNQNTISPVKSISWCFTIVKKKRQLFPGFSLMLPSSFNVTVLIIHIQDRLTHVQLLLTWNLSPLQSSKFSFEYLLLPPRSALKVVPLKITLKALQQNLHACLLFKASL
ncbi:14346_t:CDS:2 [Funneliformis caledonium]|uniref:14346_t:CDS:1 n=1 Tax=Funneliformis caledonium TaxID=1117310 RepID=A0A9N8ZM03_9GLOM|nr:14346_t:CDS:2 [Funneliformis caledonium]